jgi:hypothetical protein
MAAFFATTVLALSATVVNGASAPVSVFSSLHRRTTSQVAVACFQQPTASAPCACPTDLNGDDGVLINYYPGYQCAYPGGACTWGDKVLDTTPRGSREYG